MNVQTDSKDHFRNDSTYLVGIPKYRKKKLWGDGRLRLLDNLASANAPLVVRIEACSPSLVEEAEKGDHIGIYRNLFFHCFFFLLLFFGRWRGFARFLEQFLKLSVAFLFKIFYWNKSQGR